MSDLFNEKAKDWDADEMKKELSSAIGAAIIENVTLNEQMNVMDFGAGTGLISSHVAPLVNEITAVDISQAMLDKLIAKPELQSKVKAVCQDITAKPLADKFDLIMSAMALHHVEDTVELMQIFAEHLKQGAKVALADLDKEDGSFHPQDTQGVFHSGFERETLRTIMENAGFENINFYTAHSINKENKNYPIFLVTATKV